MQSLVRLFVSVTKSFGLSFYIIELNTIQKFWQKDNYSPF